MPPPGATLVTIATAIMDTWTGNINQWMSAHSPSYTVTKRRKGPETWDVWLLQSLNGPAKAVLESDLEAELSGNIDVSDAV
jgi:hypothetical protein